MPTAASLDDVSTVLQARVPSTTRISRLLPGVIAAAMGAALALVATRLTGVSSMLVAIILGAIVANIGMLPEATSPGITLVGKRVLRIGVAMLGLQLVIGDILALGAGMVAVIIVVVAVGITATMLIGRWLGIGLTQRLLIACGFSICGAAAVAATDGVIDADEPRQRAPSGSSCSSAR